MLNWLMHVLAVAVGVFLSARIVPGLRVRSFGGALVFALVLGVLDKVLFKILVLLSLPFVVVTFGLFVFVINAFLFWLADRLVDSVEVKTPAAALLGSGLTSLIAAVLGAVF